MDGELQPACDSGGLTVASNAGQGEVCLCSQSDLHPSGPKQLLLVTASQRCLFPLVPHDVVTSIHLSFYSCQLFVDHVR
jgi:hypothetical protein